jgi:serine/threonine protein kinase
MSWRVLNLRTLEDGGFATVYVGTRSDNGEQVVVKYLRDKTPDNRRYFVREARILARRVHQRLVEFLGGQPEGPEPYYIMPYYPGGKLTKWAGKLTHAQLRYAARQVADALAHLHSVDVAHGDVKPDNILLTRTGELRVGDPLGNGAGCTIAYGMNSGGTPGYWAPEVAVRQTPISKASDVFSFGATLYHLATGRSPVDGQNFDPRALGILVPTTYETSSSLAAKWIRGSDPA